MKSAPELIPAPKRGQYDRALSRHERQAAQQERVIAAIVAVAATGRELSVASVVQHAGIGRNTFYEYFDDVEHALNAVRARARRDLAAKLEPALQLARTPFERIRVLARVWAESVTMNRALALLTLRVEPATHDTVGLSGLARYVVAILENELDARGTLPGLADKMRVTAVGAVFDVVSRTQLTEAVSAVELQRILSDLALRLLR